MKLKLTEYDFLNFAQNHAYNWYSKVFFVILLAIFCNYLFYYFRIKLQRFYKVHHNFVYEILVRSCVPPIHFLISIFGFIICLQILDDAFPFIENSHLIKAKIVALVAAFFWSILRMITKLEILFTKRAKDGRGKLDITAISALAIISKITTGILIALFALDMAGFSISGLLAFGGASGLVVGLASKEMVANFFGALSIYMDKPFKIGDWVRVPERGIEGHVEKIGLRVTHMRTLDKRAMYVPNSIFANTTLENVSRMSHRPIDTSIGVRITDFNKINKIVSEVQKILDDHPQLDHSQICNANFSGYTEYSATIKILCFARALDYEPYWKLREKLISDITNIVNIHDSEIAQYYAPEPTKAKSAKSVAK